MRRIERSSIWYWLASLTLLSLVLRCYALGFGGDQLARPDEQNIASVILNQWMLPLQQGQLPGSPGFFEYPSLYLWLVSWLYWGKFWIGWLAGSWDSLATCLQSYYQHPGAWHLLGRIVSAVAGTLTIPLLAGLAWWQTASTRWALVAAALLSVGYLAVREAHFGVTDTLATFWVVAALLATAGFQQKRQMGWLVGALIASGLAASTKYPAALVTIAPLMAAWQADRTSQSWLKKSQLMIPLAAIALGAFLLGSPFVVLDFHTFWRDFSYQMQHMRLGHGLDLGPGWLRHLSFTLPVGLGWPLLGLAIVALVRKLFTPKPRDWPWLSFLLLYFVWVGSTKTVFVRYMLPLVPVFCLLATLGLKTVTAWLRQHKQRRLIGWVVWPLLGWMMGGNLWVDGRFLHTLSKPDTRQVAADWMDHHIPLGQGVGVGMFLSQVEVPPSHYRRWLLNPPEDRSIGTNPFGRGFIQPDQWQGQPHPDWPNTWMANTYTDIPALCQQKVHYVVLSESPLQLYSSPLAERLSLNRSSLARRVAFWPGTQAPVHHYDAIDAFFIPYQDPDGIPGPTLSLYQLNCPAPVADPAARAAEAVLP